MRNLISSLLVIAGVAGISDAQQIPYGRVVWPKWIAVGMRQGDQLSPFTVEASSTGWVSIDFLSPRPDEGLKPPPFRLIVESRDVKAWAGRARRLLETPAGDSNASETVTLGRGAYALEILRQHGIFFSARVCGPGYGTSSPSVAELLDFIALLDTAASIAGGGQATAPTLSRPYYASEVSCPVSPNADNKTLIESPAHSRAVPDAGVQYVVDTAGRVERGSIRFLPDADLALARDARETIDTWRFHRAEIDGTPVRQIVQTTIGYPPSPVPSLTANDLSIVVEPTDDGWVHFSRRWVSRGDVMHQWFQPDSIDAWLAHMWGRDSEGLLGVSDTAKLLEIRGQLGPSTGPSIASIIVKARRTLVLSIGFKGCYGSFEESGRRLGDGAIFATAAAEARKRRAVPADPTTNVYAERDVACSAWLEWTRSARKGFERVWKYPVAPYPESMRATNARADVLVSFAVDTTGLVEANTVVMIPGSDPRAVAAIPAAIKALKFRPATRSGVKVRQRVIQVLRFEPSPTCATPDSGPACQR